jgi:hypothetical protein
MYLNAKMILETIPGMEGWEGEQKRLGGSWIKASPGK